MNLKLLTLFSFSFVSSTCYSFYVPQDVTGNAALNISNIGVYMHHTSMTATPFYVIQGDTTTVVGSTYAIYGVITATKPFNAGAPQSYVRIRATNTINTATELLCPDVILTSTTRNTFKIFFPPIIGWGGFSVEHNTPTFSSTVFYRWLSSATENVNFPRDEYSGNPTYDPNFYGVKVASIVPIGGAADDGLGTEGMDFTSDERLMETSRSHMFGWSAGSGSLINYAVYEDTGSSVGNPIDILPPIFYNTMTYEDTQTSESVKNFSFPWPLIFRNGINIARTLDTRDRFRNFSRPTRSLR